MTPQERLIATAQAQDGYLGKKSNAQLDDPKANAGGRFNKFARDLDALGDFYNGKKNGFDWCDVFADWCFVQTFGRELAQRLLCQPDKSLGAGTGYSLGYYKAKGRFFLNPQPGDQIFFGDAKSTWHTGIVTEVKGGYVHTIEGNAGSPSAVRSCKYPLNYSIIKGYGRPDWSLAPAGSEKEDDNMTEEQVRRIVREECASIEAERAALPASPWAEEELAAAMAAGVTDGKRPQSYATRQEVAIMVGRKP
ncbi:MAG: CHAP domain-containing protein [Oscillospiraceae bacterium]|nr:CHAP domain-containing protein [Oscillospiraceae bacterium]MDE7172228.1 CHAP domain-containing protein [Oscillospiraceae bacterium]